MKHYDLLEHTADVGVKAYGSTVAEAFEHAAEAMFDIINFELFFLDDIVFGQIYFDFATIRMIGLLVVDDSR